MKRYKAVLFAPDGDWVTDYAGSETIEEAQERVADQGSRWFFYPFAAVIIDRGPLTSGRQRIVDGAEPFEGVKGLAINSVSKLLASIPEDEMRAILS